MPTFSSAEAIARRLTTEGTKRSIIRATRPARPDYDRQRHLPRLVRICRDDLDKPTIERCEAIIQRLAGALRRERCHGRSAHWTYDINRHLALIQALRSERALLHQLRARSRLKRRATPSV